MPTFLEPPDKMPRASAQIFGYLGGEILRTRAKWLYYKQLYLDSEHRFKKLARAGGMFFSELRNILISDLILSLARLTDPASSGGHANISIALLIKQLRVDAEHELASRLEADLLPLSASVSTLRIHRKKKIAHLDANTVLNEKDAPLPKLTLKEIRIAVEAIESFLSVVHTHFTKGQFLWDQLSTHEDADTLMSRLCMAECYEDAVKSGLLGRIDWEKKWDGLPSENTG